jgi:DNA-binding transcriptional ArsR family regulator
MVAILSATPIDRNEDMDCLPCPPQDALAQRLDAGRAFRLTYNQMVVYEEIALSDEEVDRIFRALADATRRDIVRRTLAGEPTVSQLAADYDMSFAAVQKHVAVLEGAGLVSKQPRGRERLVRGNPDTIRRAQSLLDAYEQIWRGRVARLDALLADD